MRKYGVISGPYLDTFHAVYIYQNLQDKACFQHDMSYWEFKDLPRKTTSYKVFRYKAFNIAKNPKFDGYQRDLTSMVHQYFDKKAAGGTVKNEATQNGKLAEELHKSVIRKLVKRKVHSSFINNIWCDDLADMQLISKFNKGFRFSVCVIYIYIIYVCVVPLEDKKRYYNYWFFPANIRLSING